MAHEMAHQWFWRFRFSRSTGSNLTQNTTCRRRTKRGNRLPSPNCNASPKPAFDDFKNQRKKWSVPASAKNIPKILISSHGVSSEGLHLRPHSIRRAALQTIYSMHWSPPATVSSSLRRPRTSPVPNRRTRAIAQSAAQRAFV